MALVDIIKEPPTSTSDIKNIIPLVNCAGWDRYLTVPPQVPAPSTTAGRVQWWQTRIADFPKLAPLGSDSILLHVVTILLVLSPGWYAAREPLKELAVGP